MLKTLAKVVIVIGLLAGSAVVTMKWLDSGSDGERSGGGRPGGGPGAAGRGGEPMVGGGASSQPAVPVDILVAERPHLEYVVRATGNLTPSEFVEITSEQSRRLAEVLAPEGSKVRRGDPLFRLDGSDLLPRLTELEAELERARREEVRQRELLRGQAISQSSVDVVATEVRTIAAQIAQVNDTLSRTLIRAPFDGLVGLRRVSPGAWVTPGTVLTTLTAIEPIKLDFKVPERYAGSISLGGTVRFRQEGGDRWHPASVVAVEPQLDLATRSLLIRALAENPKDALRPGAFVSVEIPLARLEQGVMIPTQSLVPSARGQSVFVVRDGKAEARPVRTGVRTPEAVQVLEGLQPGEKVVISNLLRIRPSIPLLTLTTRILNDDGTLSEAQPLQEQPEGQISGPSS
jgi:membrane fusion protein (multidrug efflux system)